MTPEEIETMKAENAAMKAEKASAAKAKEDDDKKKKEEADKKSKESEGDLNDKVAKERKEAEAKSAETKSLENSLRFNMGLETFLKDNQDILPSDVPDLVKAAEKETYATANRKAAAIRGAVIKSFFSLQANVDFLTTTQKQTLEDWQKLTQEGREERAAFVYENLFEPALGMLKRIRKAEEVGKARSGFATGNKVEDGYKNRLMAGSKKTYLGEKGER